MSKTIKQIFEEKCSGLKIDRRLIGTIRDLRVGFVNRNEDHLNFFSSNLLGVYPVRYRTVDRNRWFEEVLQCDESDIKEELSEVEALDPSWVRANDPVNLSCIWLLHKIQNESSLSNRDRDTGLMNVTLMLQYKFIGSIMAHYFPYPADEDTARATYEALSRKFEIKQHGSWQELLEYRSEMIIDRQSIHYSTFDKFRDDAAAIYMISDIQQRLREIIKKYRAVFERVREQNLKIGNSKTFIEIDGEKELIERTRDHTDYTRYLKDIITDKPTFIRQELIEIISEAMHTMKEEHLHQALEYSSENFGRGGDGNIERLIDETLLHAYRYLSENKGVMQTPSDLASLISKFKNLYSSSRMADPQLIQMRDLADNIIAKSVRSRNSAALASARTGLQLYIILRAFTKNYYSN